MNDSNKRNGNDDNHVIPSSDMSAIPQSFPDPDATSAMIAQDMNQMTMAERELVFEDLHGVAQINNEEPVFVNKCLYELQETIHNIKDKSAYNEAARQSPEYIQGNDFMLLFLRATSFDVKKAACRMVKFLEYKKFYFGSELLGRPILYSDLNAIDKDILKGGWLQVLPFRDMAGRAVVWANYDAAEVDKPAMILMRAAWYFYMAVSEDEETQKRGIVVIICGTIPLEKLLKIRDILWQITLFSTYSPFRLAGGHFCVESRHLLPAVAFSQHIQETSQRARNRIHFGCQTEWMYKLMTFGIPVNYAPITNSGGVKVKYCRQWLQQRDVIETEYLSSEKEQTRKAIIVLPGQNDVLLGRGRVNQNYAGNLLFHQILSKYRKQYANATSNKGRLDVAEFVGSLLKREQIRFLEKHKHGWWEVVTDEKLILNKIKESLRVKKSGGIRPKPKSEIDNRNIDKNNFNNNDGLENSFLDQTEYSDFVIPCYNSAKRTKTRNV